MAGFKIELPNDLIKQFEQLSDNSEKMIGEMTRAGAEKVYSNVKNNIKRAFKSTDRLERCLVLGKPKKSKSNKDIILTSISFVGYLDTKKNHPAPVVALAREYGTSRGEKAKPFFRKSFKNAEIEAEMLKVQEKYLPKE